MEGRTKVVVVRGITVEVPEEVPDIMEVPVVEELFVEQQVRIAQHVE